MKDSDEGRRSSDLRRMDDNDTTKALRNKCWVVKPLPIWPKQTRGFFDDWKTSRCKTTGDQVIQLLLLLLLLLLLSAFILSVCQLYPSVCLSVTLLSQYTFVCPSACHVHVPIMSVYTSVFHSSVRPPGCLSHSRSCPYVYVSSLFRLYLSYGRPSVCLYVTFVSHACLSVHRRRLP